MLFGDWTGNYKGMEAVDFHRYTSINEQSPRFYLHEDERIEILLDPVRNTHNVFGLID